MLSPSKMPWLTVRHYSSYFSIKRSSSNRRFKRLANLPACLAALTMLTLCNPAWAEEIDQQDAKAAQEEALLSFVNTPWTGDLDGMLERRLFRVLVVQSKTHYFTVGAKHNGITYETLTRFEKWLNKKHPPRIKHLKTRVAFVPVTRGNLIPALLEGRGDVAIAALTITPERLQVADFSDAFFRGVNEILVTGPESPQISSRDELSGREILVRRSSSYWGHLERLNAQFRERGVEPVELTPVPEELQDEDLMEMLNAGLGEMIIVDDYKAVLWSKVFPKLTLHHDITINTDGEFGWMMRKDSPLLKAAVNEFAKTHKQGTLIGNILVRRYVDKSRFVKNSVSPKELDKFHGVLALFRRYGDKYDLDHLLMMAQAYQESQLNHKAKSHVGAIGIMQLMPATGKQMDVGDVRKLEANVHAGVKYTRHIMDKYFKNEPMDDLNKTLFAFAAYNAGPGRIRGLRKASKKSGLDPNIWFNNVEVLAAKKIGSETVTYVSNIFKYYVAYKLLRAEEKARKQVKDSFLRLDNKK